MLQIMHGGASARPFVTHSNAFDTELFLRIAPELFLKRAVVGGIDRVFEINRNFRNEGADSTHSPEFAMLEAYQAYGDYNSMADLTQKLIQNAAVAVSGIARRSPGPTAPSTTSAASGTASRCTSSLSEAVGRRDHAARRRSTSSRRSPSARASRCDASDRTASTSRSCGSTSSRAASTRPTFVMDFPVDTSPARARAPLASPGVVEKWDLYIRGFELATGYSELVDPVVQRERFVEQAKLAAGGDLEAMRLDEEFLRALEFGMPPTGGMGMGIDRLLMALTGLGIRETILFPLVK